LFYVEDILSFVNCTVVW